MFERIALPYEYDALEPYLNADTIKTHYEKHHKTYTDNFNKLVKEVPEFEGKSAREILDNLDAAPADKRTGLKNNGGGFYNHNLYFESLTPKGAKPSGKLKEMIDRDFGGYDQMLEKLDSAATAKLFGSGYAWLICKNDKLDVVISPNQDLPEGSPILLLPIDMWEHAYYLKYKNEKKEYVKQFFNIINWDKVSERLEKGK
ncbi:MAG: superoxide dismutase [Planctomycetes bacterium]|nr:superoxide dismutase [Planctomycetota bacterium]